MFELILVALSIAYIGAVNVLRNMFIDMKLINEIREETKKLNEEMEAARKRKDQKAMEETLQKQMGMLEKTRPLLFGQIKYTFAILITFFLLINAINMLDPYKKDDIIFTLKEGEGCDNEIDGTFTYCFTPEREGTWVVRVEALKEGKTVGSAEKVFYYGRFSEEGYAEKPQGSAPQIDMKEHYQKGEEVIVKAKTPAEEVRVTLNNATYFLFELPFTIPIINVKKIYHPYWFFILSSFVLSITYSIAKKITGKK